MTTHNQRLGLLGEQIAERWLTRKGWRIVYRRFVNGHRDIDLVAQRDSTIAFVEVKARTGFDPAYPIRTAVDHRKRRALRHAIARWVNLHHYEGAGRIDVISVADGVVIEHLLDLGADFF